MSIEEEKKPINSDPSQSSYNYTSILAEYGKRLPSLVLIRLLRTAALNAIFTIDAIKNNRELSLIGPEATTSSLFSGVMSAPSYGTLILTSTAFGSDKDKPLTDILANSLFMQAILGMIGSSLLIAAGAIFIALPNNMLNDVGRFALSASIFPFFSAIYNGITQFEMGKKRENTVLWINVVSLITSSAFSYLLIIYCNLAAWGVGASLSIKSALDLLVSSTWFREDLRQVKKSDITKTEIMTQWNKGKYFTLHFGTEFLLPTLVSYILRSYGKTLSAAYALFSFLKLITSVLMYGTSAATRAIISNHLGDKESSNSKKISFRIGLVGNIIQLLFTSGMQILGLFYAEKLYQLITSFHASEERADVEKANEITQLFHGLVIADCARLTLSTIYNGRHNVRTPALHSLFWISLAIAASLTATYGFNTGVNTLAYITYAAFSLNNITLALGLTSELASEKKSSCFGKVCDFFKKPPELNCCNRIKTNEYTPIA